MNRPKIAVIAGLALMAACPTHAETAAFEYASDRIAAGETRWHTPVDIARAPDGSVFIAARDSGQILRLGPGMAKPECWASVDRLIDNLTIDPENTRLYAAIGHADGEVAAFDLQSSRQVWRVRVGHTPRAMVAHGGALYVACQHENDVAVLDGGGVVRARHAVEREPVDLAISADGARLHVVNQLPDSAANEPGVACGLGVIDLRGGGSMRIKLAPGAHSAQGVALSPDGNHAFVPSILSNYHLPASQIERGWIQTAGLNVIDLRTGKLAAWFLLDDVDLGAANPWDCVVLEKERKLAISLSGTHEIMFIDLDGLLERVQSASGGRARQLGELESIRRRVALPGDRNPRPLVAAGGGVWYAGTFSESLGFLPADAAKPAVRHSFATGVKPDPVREGEAAFHDATLSAQQWLSCSSCHPGNARVDALNWDLLNDGIGTFKNTKNLVGAHRTPPTTWTGVRANARVSVRAGIRHSLFRADDETTAAALDAYLSNLRFLPSPFLTKSDPELVGKGRRLFSERHCTDCHSGPDLTNLKSYDVGTGLGSETGRKYDVPTLREVWRTAPYLHDGRAPTLEAAIAELNKNEDFQHQCELREDDIAALAAYLKTL